jgi:hypothetical protein
LFKRSSIKRLCLMPLQETTRKVHFCACFFLPRSLPEVVCSCLWSCNTGVRDLH